MSDLRWNNNLIQFARLIAEIEAVGGFTDKDLMRDLCSSMDLDESEICQLISRAQQYWDSEKDRPILDELLLEGVEGKSYAIGDGYQGDATEYEWKGRHFVVNKWHDGRVEISEIDDSEEDDE